VLIGSLEERHQSPRCFVRQSDESQFAFLHKLGERTEDLGDSMGIAIEVHIFEPVKDAHRPVGPMQLIEVDVIRPESLQTCLDCFPDLRRALPRWRAVLA